MPEMPDVVATEPVESSWGNQIRDRTVQRYADSTERDALVPLPIAGDLAWLDTEAILSVWNGANWETVTNQPRFISLIRGIDLGNLAVTALNTWTDWGTTVNMGPGDPGRNFVSAQLSGSILTTGTGAVPANSTWRVRIGISADNGATYLYAPGEGIWGTTLEAVRRGIVAATSWRDIDPLGEGNSVRLKAQALLSSGGETTFERGILTAQLARSDGTS